MAQKVKSAEKVKTVEEMTDEIIAATKDAGMRLNEARKQLENCRKKNDSFESFLSCVEKLSEEMTHIARSLSKANETLLQSDTTSLLPRIEEQLRKADEEKEALQHLDVRLQKVETDVERIVKFMRDNEGLVEVIRRIDLNAQKNFFGKIKG